MFIKGRYHKTNGTFRLLRCVDKVLPRYRSNIRVHQIKNRLALNLAVCNDLLWQLTVVRIARS